MMLTPQPLLPQGTPSAVSMDGPSAAPALWMVVDVESIGLHGQAFAVAWAVWRQGTDAALAQGLWACPPDAAQGSDADRAWVAASLPPLPANCANAAMVCQRFWADWLHWRSRGATMLVDCGWPVEAQFLSACVRQAGPDVAMLGPIPLVDLATLRALHPERLAALPVRLADELPAHDPRADVRQTWRLWQALI